jgi:hypothetical protein
LSFILVPILELYHALLPLKCCKPTNVPQFLILLSFSPWTHNWIYVGAWGCVTINGDWTILQIAKDMTRNSISTNNVKGMLMKNTFQLLYVLRKISILKHLIPKFIINIKVERKKPTPTAKFFNIGTRKLTPIRNLLKNNTINHNNIGHCSKNNSSSTTFMKKKWLIGKYLF